MEQELDPQQAPEGQAPAGEGEQEVTSPETPAVDDGQALKERLEKLERSYQEAQRLIGRQGQELGQLRKVAAQVPASKPQDESIPPDAFYADPVSATTKVVTRVLSEFEARQEQRRQLERYLRKVQEQHGVTEDQLQALNEKYELAQSDPEARISILLDIHRALNASQEIEKAAQTAKDTVTRNARAVTSESGSSHVSPPGKAFEDMTGDEMRAWIKKNYGEVANY